MHGVRWQLKIGYNEAFRSREIYTKQEKKHKSRYDRTEESVSCFLKHGQCIVHGSRKPNASPFEVIVDVRPEKLVEPTLSRGFLPEVKLSGQSVSVL